jgi:acyl-coenzyme A thioesterase PaaI-like protein
MRLGRRVANVRVEAWQGSPDKPIAAARMNMLILRAAATQAPSA